jgi:hypothetical protein
VKQQYSRVYGGLQFSGELKGKPRLHHGAWICEMYVKADLPAVVFRLGHLEQLASDGLSLLDQAQAAGWSTAVASDTRQVTNWTARDRARTFIRFTGKTDVQNAENQPPELPGEGEWIALQDNLGGPPDALERALFEAEFQNVLRDPARLNLPS